MNGAIVSASRALIRLGAVPFGVRHGYAGLARGDWAPLSQSAIEDVAGEAGTVLGSARSESFRFEETVAETADRLRGDAIDRLIVIGGDGSQRGANALRSRGIRVVGVASTIDNDVAGVERTLGCATAAETVMEAADRIRATARAHNRVMVLETMGRRSGWLALAGGVAANATAIVCPELDLSPPQVADILEGAWTRGNRGLIVVVAEGATHGCHEIANHLSTVRRPRWETRCTILGHVQRGGRPVLADRLLAEIAGTLAGSLAFDGRDALVGIREGRCVELPPNPDARKHDPTHELVLRAPKPSSFS